MATSETTRVLDHGYRVERFTDEFLDHKFEYADDRAAAQAAYSLAISNAVACIAASEFAEAEAWAAVGQLALYRYRRAV